ncbi:ribbon-helix-helix protein, CopG family [Haloarcula marismortui]|uniref:ribbon-helix-helix protein, CopG family n=1 Tax=Haloarcula marismortui TaxID=2238 RepID=UPI00137822C3|nr:MULTISPECIES: ribbon-helix-helix protein, CopG family [Haloarcula]
MALQTVSFKLPEDEVAELEREANAEGKSRSEFIRSVLRARHIKDDLDDQVITKQEKEEMEETIKNLKRERDEFEERMRIARSRVESMEKTIEKTADEAVQAVRGEYRQQIRELKEENDALRQEDKLQIIEKTGELAGNASELIETTATTEDLESMEETIEEKADRQWHGTTEQRELVMELRDEIRDELRQEVKHARPLTVKALDWIRRRLP